LQELEDAPERLEEAINDCIADHVTEPVQQLQSILSDLTEDEDNGLSDDDRMACRHVLEHVEEFLGNGSNAGDYAGDDLRGELETLRLHTEGLSDLEANLSEEDEADAAPAE